MSNEIPAGTIVVGFDGSTHSERALAWSIEQAGLENRTLTLLHAVDPGQYLTMHLEGLAPTPISVTLHDAAEEMLRGAATFVKEQDPTLEVVTVVRMVDPRTALVDASEAAEMIVVGSRGRGPVARLVLGSVSTALSGSAGCPVVVIGPRTDDEDQRRGVLVGVDGTESAPSAVEHAYQLASLRGLPLTVMHVFADPTWVEGPRDIPYDTPGYEEQRLLLDQAVSGMREKYPDVETTNMFSRGLTDDALIRVSRSMDLVVVGPHRRRPFIGRLLETNVAKSLTHRAPSIVIVLPKPDDEDADG
ncbi:MAG: universal stress protein [Nocardioides sp.]|nr:universal stress protein [Nocardioides sp.]